MIACDRCGKDLWMFATRSSGVVGICGPKMWFLQNCLVPPWENVYVTEIVELFDRAECLWHREWLECW